MPIDVLVDGYNLLHAAGLAKARYAPGELHRRRARLLQKLGELLDEPVQRRTKVIFDARRDPPVDPVPQPPRLMEILFAPAPLEADDLIEQILAKHSAPRQVLVVSSDRRLQRAAKRRGAAWVSSEQFLDQIEEHPDAESISSPIKPRRRPKNPDESSREPRDNLSSDLEAELARLTDSADASDPAPPAPLDPLDDPDFWRRRVDGADE